MVNLKNPSVSKSEEEELVDCVFERNFRFPPELTIDKFADADRVLSSKESALDGRWQTRRTPYLREPMECLSPSHPCQIVAIMGATQVGKTEIMVNADGFSIVHDPCAMMNVFPNGALFSDFSVQRLKSMINNTPSVRERMAPDKSRDSSNTIGRKEFDNGILFLVTGASEISMISRPLKKVFIDEVDQMEPWVISMADDRMRTYKPYNKLYLVSTPKKKQSSIIYVKFMNGDQRHYYIACPECGHHQILVWNNIKFDRDDHYNLASEVTYACKGCGDHISEYKMKDGMDSRAEWRPHNQENGQYPSFHLPQFYSTLGDAGWESAVEKFLEFTKLKNEKNPMFLELQEAWTNSVLAEPWDEPVGESPDWEVLYNRREDYSHEKIDGNILAVLCGVDVQGDRIEAKTIGIGLNYQIWILEYKYIYGKLTDPTIWAHLDQFLLKTYSHPRGKMRILGTAIDTGYKPDEVCEFVRTRYIPGQRYVFGIKGSSLHHQPIVSAPSKNKGILLFSIGTDTTKDKIDDLLKVAEPGPGYVHFPLTLPKEYFQQLCVEKKKKEWNPKLRKHMNVWRNPNKARNESHDNFVYAIAALNILRFLEYPNNSTTQMLELLAKQQKEMSAPEQGAAAKPKSRMINEGVRIE
jgi:phage terminase large subunit GpA-like protein